jgi:hypothetical protein
MMSVVLVINKIALFTLTKISVLFNGVPENGIPPGTSTKYGGGYDNLPTWRSGRCRNGTPERTFRWN